MFIVSICIYGIIYKYPALHYAFWTGPNISLSTYCFDKTFDTHCFMFSVLCILFCYHSGFILCGQLYFVAWKEHIIGWLNSGTSFFLSWLPEGNLKSNRIFLYLFLSLSLSFCFWLLIHTQPVTYFPMWL